MAVRLDIGDHKGHGLGGDMGHSNTSTSLNRSHTSIRSPDQPPLRVKKSIWPFRQSS